MPFSSPMSKRVTMFEWERVPEMRASCWKRSMNARYCGLCRGMSSLMVLMARVRLMRGSKALYTAPMAPKPMPSRTL